MKCPTCGCENFYVKDADDEYEIYEFSYSEAKIKFDPSIEKQGTQQILDGAETYCNKCTWHGKFETKN
jgi:hypothetical protein